LAQLLTCQNMTKGSIYALCGNCHRAKCICATPTSKRSYRLTYKDPDQKTKVVYIPKHKLRHIQTMTRNYSKIRRILNQLIEINLKLFKIS